LQRCSRLSNVHQNSHRLETRAYFVSRRCLARSTLPQLPSVITATRPAACQARHRFRAKSRTASLTRTQTRRWSRCLCFLSCIFAVFEVCGRIACLPGLGLACSPLLPFAPFETLTECDSMQVLALASACAAKRAPNSACT
jgi:hypothetical protein